VKVHYIYGLIDPRDNCLRYIGQTTNLRKRLWTHTHHNLNARVHRCCWIRGLLQENMSPLIEVVGVATAETVDETEKFYIAMFRAMGARLVNIADGGGGGATRRGVKLSAETRAKISASHIGIRPSAESRAKMSASRRGRKQSPETVAKRSASLRGRRLTAEHAAKISAGLTGHVVSEETRRKLRERKGTDEARHKMSVSSLAAHERRRRARAASGSSGCRPAWALPSTASSAPTPTPRCAGSRRRRG
jgi:GIY-YIG catalytic domain/NUMOD3 motif